MYAITPNKRQYFEFEKEGKQYKVPYMRHMPLDKMLEYNKRIKKIKNANEQADAYIEFVAGIFEEHAPGSLDGLTVDQFKGLMDAYIQEGQAAAGE